MRIYDADSDRSIKNITLYLTDEEAGEMRGSLEGLLENTKHHHAHISDADFQREITVCIYREENLYSK